MHKHELEEQLREQLEESKECILRLLYYIETLYYEDHLTYLQSRSLAVQDAEKLLERLNEK